jgi:CubicO group peptidase (beta-lactamase class C family)
MLALPPLVGVWAASRPAVITVRWVPSTPHYTEHYFLVVSRKRDGTVTAFIRNPEYNLGAFIGTRKVITAGDRIELLAANRHPIEGALNPDGTLSLQKLASGDDLRFHRANARDLRWFYPLSTQSWHYQQPVRLDDGWRVGTLRDRQMRIAPIARIMNAIAADRSPTLRSPYIQSLSIERHGVLVLDQYFYGFTPQTPHDVRSAGKSVTTLMVGRAIEETHAFSPGSRVLSVLPQYLPVKNDDARKRRMTVADLMTMASGLACDDNNDNSPGNEDTMQGQPSGTDWYRYTLDLPMVSEPGVRAIYCSAGINLLGAIIHTATRIPLDQYFRNRFAIPMQFERYELWLMPRPANQAYMAGGDRVRPRDFLKFGALLLAHGRWKNHQIVDAAWTADSVKPRTAPEGEGDHYGYGWHLSHWVVDGRGYDVISAGGNGGQLMIVIPSLDVAMMVTAGNYNQFPVWRQFLPEMVATAVRSCT